MRSSAETARSAIVDAITGIERACVDAEAAFVERRWADVDAALQRQADLTEDLRRLIAAAPESGPENDLKVAQRVRGIIAYRDDQLRRMRAYRDGIEGRMQSIGKVRALSRTIGSAQPSGALYDTQR